ncbi:MAG TPA: TonB-dependent receptor [Bryobacteraceae bacterium]|nr:TonB-dependent receptor [Bryobacteraceae bacterium]
MHSLGRAVTRLALVMLLLTLGGATFLLLAQSPTGTIRLEARDPSGATVVATGTLENLDTGATRNFSTDAHGAYRFENVPFGRYRLSVSKEGFAAASVVLAVRSAAPVTRTITMALAGVESTVQVVATTPLTGTSQSTNEIAGAVQTATAANIQQSGSLELGGFLNRYMNGVYVNEMQGNPFQPDVNFRGYTASPLLGTPEGISVYLDGVRQNQPFGDVVSWDLIPQNAISEMTLMPGSNPVFGLNTLGGALSVQTKDGVSSPGLEGSFLYGASNRKQAQAEYGGGKANGFNWFLAGNYFHESGWRFDSPSTVRQLFGKLGWRTSKTDVALTYSYADSFLVGNGLQDYRLLAVNDSSVYSIPDSFRNHSPFLNVLVRHNVTDSLTFSGNAWYRHIYTFGINPNLNDDSFDESVYQPNASEQAILAAAGYTGFPASGANATNTPFPKWRCIAEALVNGDADERCDGLDIYSNEIQNDYGFSGQATWTTTPRIGRNQFTTGFSLDRGSVDFVQNSQYGYLNPDYTITTVPAWQDGSASDNPVDSRVQLHGQTPSWSLYFTDTLNLGKNVNLTVSGRFNQLTINDFDRLNPVAGPGSLDGDYTFRRFNPAVGITWSPTSSLNLYASYTQSSRAPTAIELGCADPANPCSLPNALSGDPPLQQVISGTWEAGARGTAETGLLHHLHWNAGAFRGDNRNDILFVSSPELGTGYFQNFARTRREGFDADVSARTGRVTWGLDYTYLLATYQSPAILDGAANNTSDTALSGYPGLDGNIYIYPGDRIPLIPKQNGKAYTVIQATSKLAFDLNEIAVSSSYARGNENNAYKADGVYYLGPGVSPGYAVTNFLAHYDLSKHFQVVFQVDNVFNLHYYTAAQLSNTAETAQGTFLARPFPAYTIGPQAGNYPLQSATFFSPGAPRRAWVELRIRLSER